MSAQSIPFSTPYRSGSEMMRIHLDSIRRFHPTAPIQISKRGGDAGEMGRYRSVFGILQKIWGTQCVKLF